MEFLVTLCVARAYIDKLIHRQAHTSTSSVCQQWKYILTILSLSKGILCYSLRTKTNNKSQSGNYQRVYLHLEFVEEGYLYRPNKSHWISKN